MAHNNNPEHIDFNELSKTEGQREMEARLAQSKKEFKNEVLKKHLGKPTNAEQVMMQAMIEARLNGTFARFEEQIEEIVGKYDTAEKQKSKSYLEEKERFERYLDSASDILGQYLYEISERNDGVVNYDILPEVFKQARKMAEIAADPSRRELQAVITYALNVSPKGDVLCRSDEDAIRILIETWKTADSETKELVAFTLHQFSSNQRVDFARAYSDQFSSAEAKKEALLEINKFGGLSALEIQKALSDNAALTEEEVAIASKRWAKVVELNELKEAIQRTAEGDGVTGDSINGKTILGGFFIAAGAATFIMNTAVSIKPIVTENPALWFDTHGPVGAAEFVVGKALMSKKTAKETLRNKDARENVDKVESQRDLLRVLSESPNGFYSYFAKDSRNVDSFNKYLEDELSKSPFNPNLFNIEGYRGFLKKSGVKYGKSLDDFNKIAPEDGQNLHGVSTTAVQALAYSFYQLNINGRNYARILEEAENA